MRIRTSTVVERLDELLEQEEREGLAVSEQDLAKLYDATVLDAMRWAQAAWEEVFCTTAANCWHHSGILDEDIYELVATMDKLRLAPLSIASLNTLNKTNLSFSIPPYFGEPPASYIFVFMRTNGNGVCTACTALSWSCAGTTPGLCLYLG